jgi:hypothetical protein
LEWVYAGDKRENENWFKTQDRFNVRSQYGFKASSTWSYSGLFEFNTQLSKSYKRGVTDKKDYISRFLSPARSTFSLGMAYRNVSSNLTRPNATTPNLIDLFLSPVAYRTTYMMDTTLNGRFSVPTGQHWLSTLGPEVRLDNQHQLTKDIYLRNRLNLFANMLELGNSFVTVDWRVNFDIRITRYFSFGIETWLVYDPTILFDKSDTDKTQVRKTQFQQSLMLRFTHRFMR